MLSDKYPHVSVILVNYKGVSDTVEAIRHLYRVNWPVEKLEIVVVDNKSNDGSLEILTRLEEEILIVESNKNLGFAGGCNLGVQASSGEFVAFLNNDAKPHEDWIAEAIAAFLDNPKVGAVASSVLDWEGKTIDFAGASLTWYGMGYKPLLGEPSAGVGAAEGPVLFGTGAAMFVRRDVYNLLQGFDDEYFMFFEDVDFGWRLNLAGWIFLYVPASIAYHKHHASMNDLGDFREKYLLERNALFTLFKNLGRERLEHILPAAMALVVRRSVTDGQLDSREFEIARAGIREDGESMNVARSSIAGLYAIDQFIEALPRLKEQRSEVQSARRVSDRALWPLFGDLDSPIQTSREYRSGYESLIETFPVLQKPDRYRVLIYNDDGVAKSSRSWAMAEELSLDFEITLLVTDNCGRSPKGFSLVSAGSDAARSLASWEEWADAIVARPGAFIGNNAFRYSRKLIVADMRQEPVQAETEAETPIGEEAWTAAASDNRKWTVLRPDIFLMSSSQQRRVLVRELADAGRMLPSGRDSDLFSNRLIVAAEPKSPFEANSARKRGDAEQTADEGSLKDLVPILESLAGTVSLPRVSTESLQVQQTKRQKPYGFRHNLRRTAQYVRLHGVAAAWAKVKSSILRG